MKVAVFGLGYVGAVSVAVLADGGHEVVGVDPNPVKVGAIAQGHSPVVEAGLDRLIAEGVAAGRIRATTDADDAVAGCDVSLICVGTPSNGNGSLDLRQVEKVCLDIGTALAAAPHDHLVLVRSTMLPGSTESVVVPTLEAASGMVAGRDFKVAYNPEFLREGTSVRDFHQPPYTVIGADDDSVLPIVTDLHAMVDGEVLHVPVRAAEMLKYASNAFHAVKVCFANEIGSLCKDQGIDGQLVMDVFARDRKLNVSTAYLRPGFAFGGSCLPKDLRALNHRARAADVSTPLLDAVMASNHDHLDRAFELVRRSGCKRVGVLGFSFKAGTDDLRESPIVELIERLIGKGYAVSIYDRSVSLANLHGMNRAYIENEIPHVASLMCETIDQLLERSDVVVIGNAAPESAEVLAAAGAHHVVIDLVGAGRAQDTRASYHGICW
jgi:GDP-mannose 6-dehydrogenase